MTKDKMVVELGEVPLVLELRLVVVIGTHAFVLKNLWASGSGNDDAASRFFEWKCDYWLG